MSFDWSKYCRFAEIVNSVAADIPDPGEQEAAYRSCVSRAYYSVFNLCYNRLRKNWTPPPKAEKHPWTSDRFERYSVHSATPEQIVDFKKIGADLRRLRKYRNNADYDAKLSANPGRRAKESIGTANRIIEILQKYP